MRLIDYLCLLDWTGRQVRRDKQGQYPGGAGADPGTTENCSGALVGDGQQFGRWFGTAAGSNEALAQEAKRRNRQWLQGVRHSRQAFA